MSVCGNNNKLQLNRFSVRERKYLPGNSCLLLTCFAQNVIRVESERKNDTKVEWNVLTKRENLPKSQLFWRICVFSFIVTKTDRCFASSTSASRSLHRDDIMPLWKAKEEEAVSQVAFLKNITSRLQQE